MRFNSTLDSANKLNLLKLISNLLVKLKIPEEKTKPDLVKPQTTFARRRRGERHTIGVSSEEIARARKWLEQNKPPREHARAKDVSKSEKLPVDKPFEKVQDKHLKDVINQQQFMQNRARDPERDLYESANGSPSYRKTFEEDRVVSEDKVKVPPSYYNPSATPTKCNKFIAKRTKIKRANTIDIPSFLKYRDESLKQRQKGGFALRRPIDISDKVFSNVTKVIPSFQPKTENDRKFLALISKNSETGPPLTSAPFKSFSSRQSTSVADKNWNSRFSNIKTTFDKPPSENSRMEVKAEITSESNHPEGMVIGSLKLPYGLMKQKPNGFRHAPTSPFQKIERPRGEDEYPNLVKYGYSPKSNDSMLQAKMKIFDKENADNAPVPPPRFKGPKFNKDHLAPTKMKKLNGNASDTSEEHPDSHSAFPKLLFPVSNFKENKLMKSGLNDERLDHRNSMQYPSHEEKLHQKPKRNSIATCYEAKNKYPDLQKPFPMPEEEFHPQTINYRYDGFHKKPASAMRRSISHDFEARDYFRKLQETTPPRPALPVARFYDYQQQVSSPQKRLQNVAVQTGNESTSKHDDKVHDNHYRHHPPSRESQVLRSNVSVQTVPEETQSYTPFSDTSNEDNVAFQPRHFEYPKFNHYPQGYPSTETRFSPVRPVPYHHMDDASGLRQMPISINQASKVPYQEYVYPSRLSLPKFEPDHYSSHYYEAEKPSYVPPEYTVKVIPARVQVDQPPPYYSEKNIQNQDINPDGIITRFSGAVGTVATEDPMRSSQSYTSRSPTYGEAMNDVQRHNMLQQNLIRRLQQNESSRNKSPTYGYRPAQTEPVRNKSPTYRFQRSEPVRSKSPPYGFGKIEALKQAYEPVVDSNNTQEKISIFEEKRNPSYKQHFRPVNVPKPKTARSPIHISVSPVDSSDEYLMSCAAKPSRSIVLSKSESWHQLAMSKNSLQVPGASSSTPFSKPPKPKSPFRLSKPFEASSSSGNMKKMEEKVQQYFQGSSFSSSSADNKAKRRSFASKNSPNALARSHTAPHLYDEKIFDESVDVEKAFDSIFRETTRVDERF